MCLIPLVISGLATYLQAKSVLSKKLEITSNQTLLEINRGLDNYFDAMSNQVKMLSSNADFINVELQPTYINFAKSLIKDIQKSDNDILNVYFGTESGRFIIYPENAAGVGYNHKTRPWYKVALDKRGQVVITEPYKDSQTGKAVVSIVKAVEKDGKVVGVVAMDISLETLSNQLSQIKVGESGYVFISDNKGVIIAHPQKEIIGKDEAAKLSVWNEIEKNTNGFARYDFQGKSKFSSYYTNEKTNWKLIASMNESELVNDTNSIKYLIMMAALIMGAVSIIVSFILSRGISVNINKLKEIFNKAAEGDLTTKVSIKSKDEFGELGRAFNSMMDNISNLIKNIEVSSETILETSSNLASMAEETTASVVQVSKAVEEVASGAVYQAQNSQQSAEDMADLSNKLDNIAESTEKMGEVSSDTQSLSSRGLNRLKELTEKSHITKASAGEVSKTVQDVNSSMNEINAISDTISQITEQTNLLSLNASIEAVRAGESGRGFAVVADEIRKLAEQSRSSTEEIKKIIETIKGKSLASVQAMNKVENTVKEQDEAVIQTQEIFNKIINSIFVLNDRVEEIKKFVLEIKNKKDNVLGQIESISSISEETASSTEEVSASTEEISATMDEFTSYAEKLQKLSEKLEEEISRFKL
ncbi:HAMP domain-containing protein [Clostridium bovifaecis]|uniref:HAMP domain-containing protein n=1 Tax=Clostridium bovifaecis TaxID=2184719 RepID=A0A6I6F6P0_9CLOT|nr:HAMP domain-containing protein [Clostridium bovifaecis]